MPQTSSNPYVVTIGDLARRPGEHREEHRSIVVPEQLGEGTIAVPQGSTLELDLRLESLHEGILVSGDVTAEAVGECSRCLDEVRERVEVEFAELFAYPSEEPFDYEIHDDHVDCESVVRDAVVLALPFQPVCGPDCPGLDPETGERLADHPGRAPRENIDPRWSALAGLGSTAQNENGVVSDAPEEKR